MREEIYLNEEIDRSDLKVPSDPILYKDYKRFLYSLEETSKVYPERNIALLKLQIGTGYRLQDLTDLTIGDIKEFLLRRKVVIQEKKQIRAWETYIKNNPGSSRNKPKKREVEIEPRSELENILKKYIKGKKKSEYAFPSDGKYGYITPKSFSRILKNAGENIGLKNISGHSGRKTYATWLLEDTGDMPFVSRQLGHKSQVTTMLYIGSAKKDRKRASSLISRRL